MTRFRRTVATVALGGTIAAGGFLAGLAWADQPHMQAALDALHTAEHQLDQATADKGGHRAKALELVRKAIKEVEKGIHFDRRH